MNNQKITAESLKQHYIDLLGFVPEGIENRLILAEKVNRTKSIEVIEQYREQLIYNTAIDPKIQQLVHFAMLVALREDNPAKLHVAGALKSGATPEELFAVCETAAIVGGMPLFQRAVNLVTAGLVEHNKSNS
jgi:4-carboxymuconolactone decarboxylase